MSDAILIPKLSAEELRKHHWQEVRNGLNAAIANLPSNTIEQWLRIETRKIQALLPQTKCLVCTPVVDCIACIEQRLLNELRSHVLSKQEH